MFDFLVRSKYKKNPSLLLDKILDLHAADDKARIVELCHACEEVIIGSFHGWIQQIVDGGAGNDCKTQPPPGFLALDFVAKIVDQSGNSDLTQHLTAPLKKLNRCTMRIGGNWKKKYQAARQLSSTGEYKKAVYILNELIKELTEHGQAGIDSDAGKVDEYLHKAHGLAGEAYFQIGGVDSAMEHTIAALKMCRKSDNLEGVVTYTGTLVQMMREMNLVDKNKTLVKERVRALKKLGRSREAAEYADLHELPKYH